MSGITLESPVGPRSDHAPHPRQRTQMSFFHHGHKICKVTFLQMHGIGT